MTDFTVSNDTIPEPDMLRKRAESDGYLFLKGLIEPDRLLSVRKQILELCEEAGWLKAGTDPVEGIACPGVTHVEPEPGYMEVYDRILQLEDFHALAHHPKLLDILQVLFNEQVLVHPRNIARMIFPQIVQFTTPAHQDYVHIQGTEETWTSWIPLGPCPKDQGSLAIMPGSHKSGLFPVQSAYGAGGLGIDTEALPFQWAASDFELGDLVLFHSHVIHKGLPNTTPDRIRVSVDFRYQAASQPVAEASLFPHFNRTTWDQIYQGWKSKEHQYYWKSMQLDIVEWTPEYHESAGVKTQAGA